MTASSMLPDKAILASFIDALFRHCDPEGRIAFKAFDRSDKPVFGVSSLKLSHPTLQNAAFNLAKVAATCGRTAVFCPPVATFRDTWAELGRQSTATDALHEGPALSVEQDANPSAAWETLTVILGEPTITVLSGGEWIDPETGEVQDKVHLHWRLDVPARGDALADLHEARWLACKLAGGDGTGAPVAHPLRWPGSVHNKGRAKLATIGHQTENEITLSGALAALRAAWTGEGFHDRAAFEIRASGTTTADDEDVASALSVIPNGQMPWDRWKRIGMAVWAATSGGGFDLFDRWSATSSKYTAKGTAEAWRKIDRSPPSSLGAGTLFYMANEHDPCWSKPSEQITGEDAELAELAGPGARSATPAAVPTAEDGYEGLAELRHLGAMVKAPAGDVEAGPSATTVKHDPTFPDHLTRVPGLLGRIVDWIEASSRQPSRVMALGAAFTTLGSLMGQRVAGPTESGTHLYTVVLAPSAVGKERPRQAIASLLRAANAPERIGHDEFMSQSALIKTVVEKPCCACLMDEFGSFLRKVFNPRSSSHEAGISSVLRKLWGLSFQTYKTPIWANGHSADVEWPALSIYGSSTPEEFFGSLRRETVHDGFLNRLLLLRHTAPVRDRDPIISPRKVPDDLQGALAAFNAYHAQITAASPTPGQGRDIGGPYDVMVWANDGARDIFSALNDDIFNLRQDEAVSPYYGRTAEMAVRLATIHAAGRSLKVVDAEAMAWGRDVSRWSADQMMLLVGDHMAENSHADHGNRIVRFMRQRSKPVTCSDISRHFGGALKVRDLGDVLATLLQSQRIVEIKPGEDRPKGPGRPPTQPRYRLAS